MQPSDTCPDCKTGRLYEWSPARRHREWGHIKQPYTPRYLVCADCDREQEHGDNSKCVPDDTGYSDSEIFDPNW